LLIGGTLASIVESMTISQDPLATRAGIVVYSQSTTVVSHLDSYNNSRQLEMQLTLLENFYTPTLEPNILAYVCVFDIGVFFTCFVAFFKFIYEYKYILVSSRSSIVGRPSDSEIH
jgi:hypothetical protein